MALEKRKLTNVLTGEVFPSIECTRMLIKRAEEAQASGKYAKAIIDPDREDYEIKRRPVAFCYHPTAPQDVMAKYSAILVTLSPPEEP